MKIDVDKERAKMLKEYWDILIRDGWAEETYIDGVRNLKLSLKGSCLLALMNQAKMGIQ